jgi:hypothetical protein
MLIDNFFSKSGLGFCGNYQIIRQEPFIGLVADSVGLWLQMETTVTQQRKTRQP